MKLAYECSCLTALLLVLSTGLETSKAPGVSSNHRREGQASRDAAEARRLDQQAKRLYQAGRLEEALKLVRRTLVLRKKTLGIHHPATARNLSNLGALLHATGRSREAEAQLEHALEIQNALFGPDHPDLATTLDNLGGLHLSRGDLAKAKPYIERSLTIRETVLGPDHPRTALSLNNLGNLFRRMGERVDAPYYERARSAFERALGIRENVLEPNHPETATSLDDLGELLQSTGKAATAKPYLQRALAIREKVLGADHPQTALSLHNLGVCLFRTGDFPGARVSLERALTVREKVLGDHPATARSLITLGSVLEGLGDPRQARSYYERALEIQRKVLGPDHYETADCLRSLGLLLRNLGDLAQAKTYLEHALVIYERALGPLHPRTALGLNDLAFVREASGDLPAAIRHMERALKINQEVHGPLHPAVAGNLNNLGYLFETIGDLHEARRYRAQAVAISEKTLGRGHPDTAILHNNLGFVLFSLGDMRGAKFHYETALAAFEQALGRDHPYVAQSLHNLGGVLQAVGALDAARVYFNRALAIREMTLGRDHLDTSQSLNAIGTLLFVLGDLEGASHHYERSLAIRRKTLGSEHPQTVNMLNNLTALKAVRGDLTGALKLRSQALAAEEEFLVSVLPFVIPYRKLVFRRTFEASTSVSVSLHVQSAPTNEQARDLALTTILRRKGRALEATALSHKTLRERLQPEERRVFDQLSQDKAQRAYLLMRAPDQLSAHERRRSLNKLEERIRVAEMQLARSHPFRAAFQSATIESVRRSVPQGAALIEFFKYRVFDLQSVPNATSKEPHYVAYIIDQSAPPRWIDLGEGKPIDEAVQALIDAVAARRSDVKELARVVDALTMAKIRSKLNGAQTLIISPDGALNLVPFAALVDEAGRYLLERYGLNHVTSGRDLLRSQSIPNREPPLVLGGADFDAPPNAARGEVERSADLRTLERFGSLPASAVEANSVGKTLGLPEHRILTGKEANETAVKEARGPRILHIATHGFFLADQPLEASDPFQFDPGVAGRIEDPLLRAGLALSGANRWREAEGPNDGLLTAAEVAGLDLWGTDLVVLPACGSGLGQVQAGEGVFGLRRAFVLAGSQTQLMTLWNVDDVVTSGVMRSFYEQLTKGEPRAEALRRAQLALLRGVPLPENHSGFTNAARGTAALAEDSVDPTVRGTRHPYYWAVFILSGESGPLRKEP